VRLSSVQVTFWPAPGADVQIKMGNSDPRSATAVSAMTTIARADDVCGTYAFAVRGRAAGRYVADLVHQASSRGWCSWPVPGGDLHVILRA
jgi:hypothetical protein